MTKDKTKPHKPRLRKPKALCSDNTSASNTQQQRVDVAKLIRDPTTYFSSDYILPNDNYYSFECPEPNQVDFSRMSRYSSPSSYSDRFFPNHNYYSFDDQRNQVDFSRMSRYSSPSSYSDRFFPNHNYYSFDDQRNQGSFQWRLSEDSRTSSPQEIYRKTFSLKIVEEFSEEYERISKYFKGLYYRFIDVFRIKNPAAEATFSQRLLQLERRGEKPEVYGLFHDTMSINVNSICQNNFDERLGRRFKFGPGVYFSTRPDNAFRRSSYKTYSVRAMFLVDVLVNKVVHAKKEAIYDKSDDFDTLICHNGSTYRKNDKSEYVPKYVAIYWPRERY